MLLLIYYRNCSVLPPLQTMWMEMHALWRIPAHNAGSACSERTGTECEMRKSRQTITFI